MVPVGDQPGGQVLQAGRDSDEPHGRCPALQTEHARRVATW